MYTCTRVKYTGQYSYTGGTYTPTHMYPCTCTSVGEYRCIHEYTFTRTRPRQTPHQARSLSRPPAPHGPRARAGGGASGGSQSEPRGARPRGGAGAWGAGVGVVIWGGACSARALARRQAPQTNMAVIYIPPQLGQWAGALPACPAGGAVS